MGQIKNIKLHIVTDIKLTLQHGTEIKRAMNPPNVNATSQYSQEMEACKSTDHMKRFYDHCQSNYNRTSLGQISFNDIREYVVTLLKEYLPDTNSLVLDIGCETGETGNLLHSEGFINLQGIGNSSDALLVSRE